MSFLTDDVKQKNKNGNMEYQKILIPFKIQFYSWQAQGSPIFLLLGSWALVKYLYVWVKSKFFPI